jgi:iron-sulfur cluster insertion protein
MVTFTDNAKRKIIDLLAEEGNPALCVRMFVQGGGCSGFQYGFTFDEHADADDFIISIDETRVVRVDPMSLQYLNDASVDYEEGLMESAFKVNNPTASTTCGCGSSFSI